MGKGKNAADGGRSPIKRDRSNVANNKQQRGGPSHTCAAVKIRCGRRGQGGPDGREEKWIWVRRGFKEGGKAPVKSLKKAGRAIQN